MTTNREIQLGHNPASFKSEAQLLLLRASDYLTDNRLSEALTASQRAVFLIQEAGRMQVGVTVNGHVAEVPLQSQGRFDLRAELTFPLEVNIFNNSFAFNPRTGLDYFTDQEIRDRTFESYLRRTRKNPVEMEEFYQQKRVDVRAKILGGLEIPEDQRAYHIQAAMARLEKRAPYSSYDINFWIGIYDRDEAAVRELYEKFNIPLPRALKYAAQIDKSTAANLPDVSSEAAQSTEAPVSIAEPVPEIEEPAEPSIEIIIPDVIPVSTANGSSQIEPVRPSPRTEARPRSMVIPLLLTDDEILRRSPTNLNFQTVEHHVLTSLLLGQRGYEDLPELMRQISENDWRLVDTTFKNSRVAALNALRLDPFTCQDVHAKLTFIRIDPGEAKTVNQSPIGIFLVDTFANISAETTRKLLEPGFKLK